MAGSTKAASSAPEKMPEVKAVVFLGPYHRYSRGDTACFDATHADELVDRHIAVWPEEAEKVLTPPEEDGKHDTDIG